MEEMKWKREQAKKKREAEAAAGPSAPAPAPEAHAGYSDPRDDGRSQTYDSQGPLPDGRDGAATKNFKPGPGRQSHHNQG